MAKVYICSKCGTAVTKDSTPSGWGCPHGGSHDWYPVCSNCSTHPGGGRDVYQCSKCGVVVYSDSSPMATNCSSGGSHLWSRL